MRAYAAAAHAGMEWANLQNRTARAGAPLHRAPPAGGNGSCVAMHIRRTDKHSEDHRTAQRGFKDFVHIYKSWAYWSYVGVPAQVMPPGAASPMRAHERKTLGRLRLVTKAAAL
eukprot:1094619-Prymnesium_polylepis.1